MQLGRMDKSLAKIARHQARSGSGTLSRTVVMPPLWLMIPPVVKSRKRKVEAVTRSSQPKWR